MTKYAFDRVLPRNIKPILFECYTMSEREYAGMPLLYSSDDSFFDYFG